MFRSVLTEILPIDTDFGVEIAGNSYKHKESQSFLPFRVIDA